MRHALTAESSAIIEEFARHDALLALDYDGTLAPIVDDRTRAHMREPTQRLVAQVARRMPTIFISGRGRLDVLRFLGSVKPMEVIGNHGLEAEGAAASKYIHLVRGWKATLERALEGMAGVIVEDKRYSLAVHFRHCPDKQRAKEAIGAVVGTLEGARLIGGIDVVNVLPVNAPNKGDALIAAMGRWNCGRAVFVGDDETDEDVFELRDAQRVLTIRVGFSENSAAQFFLEDQGEVDALLEMLCKATLRGAR